MQLGRGRVAVVIHNGQYRLIGAVQLDGDKPVLSKQYSSIGEIQLYRTSVVCEHYKITAF